MKQAKEKMRRSSLVAVVLLSLASLWCGVLLAYRLCRLLAADLGAAGMLASRYAPVREVVSLAILLAMLGLALSLFISIRRQGTPFLPAIPRRMKWLAVLVFALSEAPNWAGYLLEGVLHGRAAFAVISNSGFVGLVMAAVMYALAVMFQYGCLLQQENDETL